MIRIVFLTYDKEALDYEKNHREDNDIVLPIGPSARYYALSKGWEILTLESLFRKEEYFLEKEDSDQRIKTLVKELNEYSKLLAKNFPLEIGNYFNNHLLIVIGSLHYNFFILKSILKKINPTC